MEKQKKIGFFKKIYMSVFKLEDYSQILEEKKSNAFKYFCLLCVIVTLIFSVFSTIDFGHKFDKAYSFFKTIPEFEYNNGTEELLRQFFVSSIDSITINKKDGQIVSYFSNNSIWNLDSKKWNNLVIPYNQCNY